MASLSLALLGSFQATLDQTPISKFKSAKVRALLVYLLMEADRSHRREALAGMLWPSRSTSDALASLRFALSNLRSAIGDRQADPSFLIISRETLQFNLASDHWLDVREFESFALNPVGLDQLEPAVNLYRGDFLEGFTINDSPAFEEWVLFKREPLHQKMLSLLQQMVDQYESRGSIQQALVYTRRQLDLAPWYERGHRQMMRFLALMGERGQALAQYQKCRQALSAELGIEPEPETTFLYECIRDNLEMDQGVNLVGRPSAPGKSAISVSRGVLSPLPPLVARENELARLEQSLEKALAGGGQVVFIIGDAGSGKTALADEFVRRAIAAHGDLVAAWGNCNAQAGVGDPYLPFREILQMLTGDVEGKRAGGTISHEHARRLWSAFPDSVSALLTRGPELVDLFVPVRSLEGHIKTISPLDPSYRTVWEKILANRQEGVDSDRASGTRSHGFVSRPSPPEQTALFAQVTEVLLALSESYPLLLVLDDLQWGDAGSISLLFHLGRRISNSRILLIGTYRPEDVTLRRDGGRHPLEPVVNELQRQFGNVEIDLMQAQRQKFIDALIDAEPNKLGAAFRKTLFQHTAGNPLFTVELLKGLQEKGDLIRNENGHWVESETIHWEHLPARIEAIIAERFERLPPKWQAVLAVASVEGEIFTAEVVSGVQNLDERNTIRQLSGSLSKRHRLVQAHSLQRVGAQGQRFSCYRFRHHLFQKYLYGSLDDVERVNLHEAVGNVLEKLYLENANGEEEKLAAVAHRLAWHFEAAGLVDKAIGYLKQAGDRSVRMSAYQEAIGHYTRGLKLLKTLPASEETTQRELSLQLALGIPLQAMKSYGTPERGQAYARAHELSLRLGDMPQIYQTLLMQWSYYLPRAEHKKAFSLAEQILNLAGQIEEPTHKAVAHIAMGITQTYLGAFDLALVNLEQGVNEYDAGHRQPLNSLIGQDPKVSGLAYLSWVLLFLGFPDQADQRVQDTVALARTLNHPFSLGFALSVASSVVHLRSGRFDLALKFAEELLQLGEKMNFAFYHGLGMCTKGRVLTERGRMDEGIASMREGLAICKSVGTRVSQTQQLGNYALACKNAGLIQEGLQIIESAQALVEETGERHFEAELWERKGRLMLLAGDARWREAEACFVRAIQIARRQHAKSWELRAVLSLCRLRQGREGEKQAEAQRMLKEVYDWFTEGFETKDIIEVRRLLAKHPSLENPKPGT
ncbi:MAG: BTAD domain-containing putative transcriptional regulator [Anaerolineae bacterium]